MGHCITLQASILAFLLCIATLSATGSIAASELAKRGDSGRMSINPAPSRDVPPASPERLLATDINPISFDDIMQGRFVPVPVSETHIAHLLEGDRHPDTLLFADPPKGSWAPIIDLTYPRPFRSLNALMQRYRHLHIYRLRVHPYSDSFDSIIVLLRRPPKPNGIMIAPGARIAGLNERIRELELIRRQYGTNVAWARFHKTFTPIGDAENDVQKGSRTWADIVASPFLPSVGVYPADLRQHLDRYRMAKVLSFDGRNWLGIRVNAQGIADHLEQQVDVALPHV